MKKLISECKKKDKELSELKQQEKKLLSDQSVLYQKRIDTKLLLSSTELDQIGFLRTSWSQRQVDGAFRRYEAIESGSRANVCAPGSVEDDLAALRGEVDEALTKIYGAEAVESMRKTVFKVKISIENIEKAIQKTADDLEIVAGNIINTERELSNSSSKCWAEIFYSLRDDLKRKILPDLRRCFVAANGHNPYFLNWGDARFFFLLFNDEKFSIAELLTEREKMKSEFFGQ